LALTREYFEGALADAPASTRLDVTSAAATIAVAMNARLLNIASSLWSETTESHPAVPRGVMRFMAFIAALLSPSEHNAEPDSGSAQRSIRACRKDQRHMMRMKFAAMLHSQH
jgi:hypothetical protein